MKNYSVLQELWDQAISIVCDTETISRIRGIDAHMRTFDFFFGLVLGEFLLRHTDNISRTLQKNFSASEGQIVAEKTKVTLLSIRNEASFDSFWEKVVGMSERVDVEKPRLSRRRRVPRCYEDGNAEPEYPTTPEEHYDEFTMKPWIYLYKGLKIDSTNLVTRYTAVLKNCLSKLSRKKSFRKNSCSNECIYGDDLHASNLKAHLEILSQTVSQIFFYVKAHLQQLTSAQKVLISEVILLAKLNLVMPATNATSERSFSALRRMKTYLRSTMKQERLNSIMTLHIHKDLTDG